MTVFSRCNSRPTSLYGLRIGTTRSTPGSRSSGWSRSGASSPMAPMIVRSHAAGDVRREPEVLDALDDVVDLGLVWPMA